MVTDQYIKIIFQISKKQFDISIKIELIQISNMEVRIKKQKDLKVITNQLFQTNNYSKRAYDDRNNYRTLLSTSKNILLNFENQYIQLEQNGHSSSSFSSQFSLINQQSKTIITIFKEISSRLQRQCKQKYQLFNLIFNYTIQTINRLQRLFEMNLCEYSKNILKQQQRIQASNYLETKDIRKQNQLLIQEKQHKWRNLYMIIKDNRVLRRQKGKILRRNRQQIWRANKFEEQLVYYKKQYQKYRFLLDSLKQQENYKEFIQNQLILNRLQKKIKQYPKKAKKILKDQLIDLEINQLNSFDKKIGKILQIIQRDNQFYDDYDDCEQNIQKAKLFYNISTQTQIQVFDQSTNTISQPPKIFQSCKVQTKIQQIQLPLAIYQVLQLQIRQPQKKKFVQRKTRYGIHGISAMKMSENPYFHSRTHPKKSSFDLTSKPPIMDSSDIKKKILKSINTVSLIISNTEDQNNKKDDIIDKKVNLSITTQRKKQKKRNVNFTERKVTIMRPISQKETQIKVSIKQMKKQQRDIVFSYQKQISICIFPHVTHLPISNLNETIQKRKSRIKWSTVQEVRQQEIQLKQNMPLQQVQQIQPIEIKPIQIKPRQKSLQIKPLQIQPLQIKNVQNLAPLILTKQKVHIHKRQKTEIITKKQVRQRQTTQQNNLMTQTNKRISLKDNQQNLYRMSSSKQIRKINGPMNNTFSNYFPNMNKDILKKQNQCTPQQQLFLNTKYMMNIVDKILKNISLRRKQLLASRQTFTNYLCSFFISLYGNTDKKGLYLLKFKNGLIQNNCLKKDDKIQEEVKNYQNVFIVLKRLSVFKEQLYDIDIFVLFITLVETAEKLGIPISTKNYQEVNFQYGSKVIEYVCSVYFSEKQTTNFLQKYKILNCSYNVNLWKFFYCLQEQLKKIVQQSQLKQLLEQITPGDNSLISYQLVNQLTLIIGSTSTQDSLKRQGLKKYTLKGISLHRMVLYGYRYQWQNLLNINKFINKYFRLSSGVFPRLYIQEMLQFIDQITTKNDDLPTINEIYKNWRQQYNFASGNKDILIPTFYYVALKLIIIHKQLCKFNEFNEIQSAYKKLLIQKDNIK